MSFQLPPLDDATIRQMAADTKLASPADSLPFFQDGRFLKISVRWWSGMAALTSEEVDLPPEAVGAAKKLLKLGKKRLVPEAYLSALKSGRVMLAQNRQTHTIPTSWGFFLPMLAYLKWRERHDQIISGMREAVEELCQNLPTIKAEIRGLYAAYIRDVWQQHRTSHTDEEVETFVRNVIAAIPDADEIREAFVVKVELQTIPVPQVERDAEGNVVEQDSKFLNALLGEVEAHLMGAIAELAKEAEAACLKGSGNAGYGKMKEGLHPATVGKLRKAIERLELFNLSNSGSATATLVEIRHILDTKATRAEALGKFQDIVTAATGHSRVAAIDL